MRTLIIVLTIFLVPVLGLGQYYVIKVEPEGMVLVDNQPLKRRDKISADAELKFSTNEAFVHVLSPTNGHFVLSGTKAKKNNRGEFIIAFKEALIPTKEFKAAATRSKSLLEFRSFEHEFDFKKYFQGEMVFLDTVSFTVATEKYPLDENHFFYVKHQLKEDSIIYRLPQEKDSFSLFPQLLLNKDGKNLQDSIISSSLVYANLIEQENDILATFTIHFLSPEEVMAIKTELKCIRDVFPEISQAEFIEEQVNPYLSFYYGKFRLPDIKQLIK